MTMTSAEQPITERMIRTGDLEWLRSRPSNLIAASVLLILNEYAAGRRPVDSDALLSLGVRLGLAGHADTDTVALGAPLSGDPGRRIDVVSLFLTGVWSSSSRTSPPSFANVSALATLRGTVELDIDSEYSYIQALCQALRSDSPEPAKSFLASQLTEIARRPYPEPWKTKIASLTRRALSRAGP